MLEKKKKKKRGEKRNRKIGVDEVVPCLSAVCPVVEGKKKEGGKQKKERGPKTDANTVSSPVLSYRQSAWEKKMGKGGEGGGKREKMVGLLYCSSFLIREKKEVGRGERKREGKGKGEVLPRHPGCDLRPLSVVLFLHPFHHAISNKRRGKGRKGGGEGAARDAEPLGMF